MRIFKAPYQKNDLKKMKKRRRRRRSRVWTWRRVICTAAAAAATSGWLEVPCMMPCNTPLYKSMWRLFSLISACTRHYLILIWTLFSLSFPSSSALGFFSRHLFFHQKCTGYLLMLQSLSCIKPSKCGECLRNRKKKTHFFWRITACQKKSFGLYNTHWCMVSLTNCLQLWRNFRSRRTKTTELLLVFVELTTLTWCMDEQLDKRDKKAEKKIDLKKRHHHHITSEKTMSFLHLD